MEKDLKLFNELAQILLEEEQSQPVAKPIDTEQLYDSLDLELPDEPTSEEDFKASLLEIIKYTPKTASSSFFNQLYGGRVEKATLGDLLAVMLNTSMYTYKIGGPQIGIEKIILKKICEMIGYGPSSDGTFAPGGSMSNFMAMVMARDKHSKTAPNKGVTSKMIVYTSEVSHYSINKNAALMGIGRNQVREVKTNDHGEMLPEDLEMKIKQDLAEGHHPFFVNCTAGTTVMGAFDDVTEIHKVSSKYNLWLHLDGAYCGSVIFSKKYAHLVKGIELTDSFSVNAHKMLGTPLSCSIIVTQNAEDLHISFSSEAEYLYQTDGDDYNLGKTSLQCGRRNDALKFWTLWKSIGTQGLETIVDKQFQLADVARNYVSSHPDYTLYSFDNSISVCFNYKKTPAKQLCTALYENAKLMVSYGTFKGQEFVRLVTINSILEEKDIMNFFAELETFVQNNNFNPK
ncbi:aminotransferase class V-fold PLP-dependent enzyme [Mangrovimonas sp. DI 80]|uniref:pyridoxal phosphate-dependent decarboxylase family protein n=1 Tax=Mangrovimonas sp. DI 80 TaxID=1779330 RepID=UPI000978D04F|nr:pyridoxal-dependent decarboxylase [Mangrovimonas sp. DI 80]OMP31740.1 cysteine synthase [Mangrovimonas sp. DI 80]